MGMNNLYLQIEGTHFDSEKKRFCVRVNGEDVFFGRSGDRPKFLNIEEYNDGISDLLQLVDDMRTADKKTVFGYADLGAILKYNTISKIKEKYIAWGDRPKVGDEVEYDGDVGIVYSYTSVMEKGYVRVLVKGQNTIFIFPITKIKKTGRHFDASSISALAEYMGTEDDYGDLKI